MIITLNYEWVTDSVIGFHSAASNFQFSLYLKIDIFATYVIYLFLCSTT